MNDARASKDAGTDGGAGSVRIQHAVDEIVAVKARLNETILKTCAKVDQMHRISSELGRDTRKLERELDESLPIVEDWVKVKVSEIKQLKSQIMFIHKMIEEDS
eukprot:CAMPEP_0174959046 /NCGR_PEP_ID=MMETSP0004_2-20121128/2966_1 /TAXON_ID=420556 /ORGANISM="Ochromonas sp., Strain CCMP1393" /LENGTH=103 /DNA_ID=CAMNT_0016207335 /DNA_START=84 /DNA_END=395 /DNA_ORIENTATION=+